MGSHIFGISGMRKFWLGAGQKVQGGWAGGNESPVPQKNMTHPPIVAQNFGDPPLTIC